MASHRTWNKHLSTLPWTRKPNMTWVYSLPTSLHRLCHPGLLSAPQTLWAQAHTLFLALSSGSVPISTATPSLSYGCPSLTCRCHFPVTSPERPSLTINHFQCHYAFQSSPFCSSPTQSVCLLICSLGFCLSPSIEYIRGRKSFLHFVPCCVPTA